MAVSLTSDQMQELQRELAVGNKLQAVKRYKEWSGESLMASKLFVEAMERGSQQATGLDTSDALVSAEKMDEILDAIESGEKLRAVKIYRDTTGQSLMESKQFVERLMDELGIVHKSGCVLLVAMIGVSAITAASVVLSRMI